MSYRDAEIMGNVGFGLDQYPSSYCEFSPFSLKESMTSEKNNFIDPYIPIENEPMGPDYSASNFDSTDGNKIYPYNPLTYKTNSRSYLDSWGPLPDIKNNDQINEYFTQKNREKEKDNVHKEKTKGKEHCCGGNWNLSFLDDKFDLILLVVFIFIVLVAFAYMQNKQTENLQKIIEMLVKSELAKLSIRSPVQ